MLLPYEKPMVTEEASFEARSGACLNLPQSCYQSVDSNMICGGVNCSFAQGFPAHTSCTKGCPAHYGQNKPKK